MMFILYSAESVLIKLRFPVSICDFLFDVLIERITVKE